jgi:hypothetical protein
VALDGEGAVRAIDLSTFSAGAKFFLGSASAGCGVLKAFDLKVLPGSPQSVAIIRSSFPNCAGSFQVVIYDNGVQRSNVTPPDNPPISSIAFSQLSSTLYGVSISSSGFDLSTMAVDSLGVSITDTTVGLIPQFGGLNRIEFNAGRIYASGGFVIDPVSRTLVGRLQSTLLTIDSLVKPDSLLNRVFTVQGTYSGPATLLAFDMSTLQSTGSMLVEGNINGICLTEPPFIAVASFIRWGADGVAFRTSGCQVGFAHTASIQ